MTYRRRQEVGKFHLRDFKKRYVWKQFGRPNGANDLVPTELNRMKS
jgi:hypothetical protein